MELEGVLWSDWGSERRIVETLERIGKSPLFPAAPEGPLVYAGQAA
jgi:hypothetical protein